MICFIAIFLITTYLIRPVRVDGRSMYPTLEDDDIGIMNIISRKMFGVDRYDVVVVYNDKVKEDWVKRVIDYQEIVYMRKMMWFMSMENQLMSHTWIAIMQIRFVNAEIILQRILMK